MSSELEEARTELATAAVDLLVVVGLMGSVVGKMPEHVEENFVEKIEQSAHALRELGEEFTRFGEAFDEEV